MNAQVFVHPAYARTAPNPRPLPWDRGRDVRALATYIRAVLLAHRSARSSPPPGGWPEMTAAIPPDLLALGNLMADELEALAAAKCVPEICEDWLIIARCWRAAIARIDQDHPITQESSPC